MRALQHALDAARRAKGLTWIEALSEINKPFTGTSSIPIHLATIKGMTIKRSVTSGVVLQALAWLGRAPEIFLADEIDSKVQSDQALPAVGPGRILRFDTAAMYAALDRARHNRAMTWKQVAAEMPGFTGGMLTNLATGPLIGFPRVMFITQWLGQPAVNFVRVRGR